jgi:Na+-translocating ferredoxin:NAD+ oxidoreductase RnfA subunit
MGPVQMLLQVITAFGIAMVTAFVLVLGIVASWCVVEFVIRFIWLMLRRRK